MDARPLLLLPLQQLLLLLLPPPPQAVLSVSAKRLMHAPTRDLHRNVRPLVAQVVLQRDDAPVLILRPRAALDGGVEVVVPAARGRRKE